MTVDVKGKVMKHLKEEVSRRRWNDARLAEHLDESVFTVNKWLHTNKFPRPIRARKLLMFLTDNVHKETYFIESTAGEKLYLLRHWEGLTIQEVADALGVGHSALSKWEKNKRPPADSDLRKLLRFYGSSPAESGIEINEETFGDRLQDERIMADMTQFRLSDETAISPTRLSHFENNKLIPTAEEIKRLATSLDIPLDALVLAEDGLPFNGILIADTKQDDRKPLVHITYTQRPTTTTTTY